MKHSAPLPRRGPLPRTGPPDRRTALRRRTPLARSSLPASRPSVIAQVAVPSARRPGAASEAQRAKIIGRTCVVCQKTNGLTPAHLAPRSLGGCDHPDCVVPMCWRHHRAYDTGRLDLLAYLEPRWRKEIAHAVGHLGLIGAYRRLIAGSLPSQATRSGV